MFTFGNFFISEENLNFNDDDVDEHLKTDS